MTARKTLEYAAYPVLGHVFVAFLAMEEGSTVRMLFYLLVAAAMLGGRAGYKGRPLWESAFVGAWPPVLFDPLGVYALFSLGRPSYQLSLAFQSVPREAAPVLLAACALLASGFGWSFGKLRRVEGR